MQNARELLSSHSRREPILLARPRAPDRARASLRIGWQRLRVLDARPPVVQWSRSDQEGLLVSRRRVGQRRLWV